MHCSLNSKGEMIIRLFQGMFFSYNQGWAAYTCPGFSGILHSNSQYHHLC